jgi:hypothetical protein
LIELQGKNEPKAIVDVLEQLATDAATKFDQEISVQGNHLGDVRNGVSRQACGFRGQQHVARSINEAGVGAQHNGDHGLQATPIEAIALNDQNGAVVPRFGAVGFAKVRPPNLAAFNYHVSRDNERL